MSCLRKQNAYYIALQQDKFFVRPWEISSSINRQYDPETGKSFQEIRQSMYESIVDEAVFIARASEGAISTDWVMTQPISIRKKYVDSFTEELKERKQRMESKSSKVY